MFKSRKVAAKNQIPTVPPPPPETPEEIETRRIIARGDRLRALSADAAMWRDFASGCEKGRWVRESSPIWNPYEPCKPLLSTHMDEDTAPMWKEFALRMAQDRESRLRDVLSGC